MFETVSLSKWVNKYWLGFDMTIVKAVKIVSFGVAFTCASLVAPSVLDRASESLDLNVSFGSTAHAQDDKKKTRRLPGIGPKVMKALGEITELVSPNTEKDPNAKPNFPEALKVLQKTERQCEGKCNKYELAQIHRFYAFAYFSMDNIPKTIQSYKMILKQSPEIPIAVELEALNYLSQLLYGEEDYQGSLEYLNAWMELSTIVGAEKFFFRGQIYYTMNKKTQALKDVGTAVKMYEDKGKPAKEQWYGLQLAILLEKENFKAGKPILEKLIRHYPKIKWWTQYANVNGLLNDDKRQLAALDAVNVMGGLKKRQEVVNTAYLYLGESAPYEAAQVLEKGMKAGHVPKDVKNLQTLANAYRQAKEYKEAINAYEQAAAAAKKEDAAKANNKGYKAQEGNIYADIAAVHGLMNNSKESVDAGKKALAAGKLKRACEVHTNMGIAYVDMKKFQSAINSFEKAREDKRCRAIVGNWIRFAQNEKKAQDVLAKEK